MQRQEGIKKNDRSSVNLLQLIMVITICIISCSKSQIHKNNYQYDAYKLISDWYTVDTLFLCRFMLWKDDSIWRDETKLALDTINDRWWQMCATEKIPLHLEHWYYLKNGKKIHPSVYPKSFKLLPS